MIRQTNIAQTIELAAERARYDECAKKLLTYKAVIAWILKECTKEFSKYSIQYICENCLSDNVEISQKAVHQDQLNSNERLDGDLRLEEMNTEAGAILDQTVYFDIRFKAVIPGRKDPVQLIINLEIQLNDTPGYPIVMRGFYYCARMISEQYGTVFTNEEYQNLQKTYSIWICPDPARKRKNGIFRYHTVEEIVHGETYTNPESYDLMEVVVLNLGDADNESEWKILNLLNVLFSTTVTSKEKKRRLNDEFNIAMTTEFESEVRDMCNLSRALVEQGIEKGMEQGMEQKNMSFARMMLEDNEPIEKIEKYTGYSREKIKEIAEMMGKAVQEV